MKPTVKATIALFGGLAFMSFAAVLIKAAEGTPGIVTSFYRMFVGSLVLAGPFLYYLVKNPGRFPRRGILLAIISGIFFGFDMSLWSTGVVMSNATIPTLVANLAPIWVGFGTLVLFKKHPRKGFWYGLLIAMVGILVLVNRDIDKGNHIIPGALLGLGAGFFYGMFYLTSEPGRRLLDTLPFLFISTLSSALLLAIAILVFGYNFTGYSQQTYLLFLTLGVGVQVCGWFLINFSQGFLPATTVSPTLLGQPVFTYLWAYLLLDEKLSGWHLAGSAIVVAGIYFVHYHRHR
ncbi:MAG: DMT family transporter [Bacteroidales bacterium]|nr:DMT family transporter [Bacteroidales bacterium]